MQNRWRSKKRRFYKVNTKLIEMLVTKIIFLITIYFHFRTCNTLHFGAMNDNLQNDRQQNDTQQNDSEQNDNKNET
jgi:hypothetical protein